MNPNPIPEFIKPINIQISPRDVFSSISDEMGAILLDSGQTEHENSQYDIILSKPLALLTYSDGHAKITSNHDGNIQYKQGDPFTIAEELWLEHKPPFELSTDLPFAGGVAGWFSYDLGRNIEAFDNIGIKDFDLPQLMLGVYDWGLIYDNKNKKWFALDLQPKLNRVDTLLNKSQIKRASTNTFVLTQPWQANMSQNEYTTKFNKVKSYLTEGDCYQINLAQRFEANYTGNLWQAYLKLTKDNQAPFSAFIKTDKHTVLCLSPERFLKLKANKIQTKPIKGTLPRGKTAAEDQKLAKQLLHSEKDRAENLMIVDLLRNDISKVATPKSVHVPHLFKIESFPAVHHLVSTITGELAENKSAFDLLRGAFPGGSITGAPKIRAMQIIEELEPHRRDIYCGSIGYIDWNGKMDTNIAIRTLLADDKRLCCWAGGGLVIDSNVTSEYQETYHKVAKILPAFEVQSVNEE
ncbi:aminodeoxychorismate synthase component I [Algibacillus agarilyticus]|uniref:aminodeoxychorismate synthase component I n=1 Tax=Algibacillus agarilyticus TaxID=2234133 RepID=UPI000DD0EABB|nr:aminodeoxychorismate synthase component I [Algibacillus agarilyticus]